MYSYYRIPRTMRMIDLAIYIDNHIGTTDEKELETVFIYMYNLFRIGVLHKHIKGFSKYRADRVDDFSLYSASQLYLRWVDKNQPPIKSILNYFNKSLNFWLKQFIDYEGKSVIDLYDDEPEENKKNMEFYHENDWMHDTLHQFCSVESRLYIDELCKSIKNYLRTTPYKDEWEFECIYSSCVLSLLSATTTTITKRDMTDIRRGKYSRKQFKEGVEMYCDLGSPDHDIVLFGLPGSMHDYIYLLVKEIKDMIAEEIGYTTNSSVMESQLRSMYDTDLIDEEWN